MNKEQWHRGGKVDVKRCGRQPLAQGGFMQNTCKSQKRHVQVKEKKGLNQRVIPNRQWNRSRAKLWHKAATTSILKAKPDGRLRQLRRHLRRAQKKEKKNGSIGSAARWHKWCRAQHNAISETRSYLQHLEFRKPIRWLRPDPKCRARCSKHWQRKT